MIALGLSFFLLAAASDVTGKWNCTATTPSGSERKFEMTVKEDAGKLGGSLASERGSLPLDEVTLTGNDLNTKFTFDVGTITLKLTVSGKELKGNYSVPDGTTGPLACSRPAEAAAGNIAGTWKVTAQRSQGGDFIGRLELKEEGGQWRGTLQPDDGDLVPLSDVKVDNSGVSFAIYTGEGNYSVTMKLENGVLNGSYKDPGGKTFPVKAVR